MYKSIIFASILAAVSADPNAQFQIINPAPLTPQLASVSPAPAVVTSRSSQVVIENNNAFVAADPLKTPSSLTAPLVAAPILAAQFADRPSSGAKTAPPAILSSSVAAAPLLSQPAPVVTNSVPVIAAKSASIVAAPALTRAPLVAGPLIFKSGRLIAPAAVNSRATLLAGPGASAIYNSVISPYVFYPYASSAYINQVNLV